MERLRVVDFGISSNPFLLKNQLLIKFYKFLIEILLGIIFNINFFIFLFFINFDQHLLLQQWMSQRLIWRWDLNDRITLTWASMENYGNIGGRELLIVINRSSWKRKSNRISFGKRWSSWLAVVQQASCKLRSRFQNSFRKLDHRLLTNGFNGSI